MIFNPDDLQGETEDVLRVFIDHVTRSEEEEKKEEKQGERKTDVKVFVAENQGFELGDLSQYIHTLVQKKGVHKNIQSFITEHNFNERKINDEVSYVEIETPEYARIDQFVFIDDGEYLRVISAERRKWTKRTVERLIDYLPNLERIFLSPSDLEEIVNSIKGADVSGFTAKYHSYDTDKRISIRFHGGDEGDLETVEEEFGAKPTRLEFDQSNSPDAVSSAIAQEGHFTYSNVREGYEQTGIETFRTLSSALEESDKNNFKIDINPERIHVGTGEVVRGCTTLNLIETFSQVSNNQPVEERLREEILDYKDRYAYSVWEPGKFEVYDSDTREAFEVTIEEKTIRVHAKEATTSASFRDFAELLYETFNSTYRLNKSSTNLIKVE